jgi:hypothetical protein
MPFWLLLLLPAVALLSRRPSGGGGGGGYNQSVDFGGGGGGVAPMGGGHVPVWSYDGTVDLTTLAPGQTYYSPTYACLAGDTRFQQVYCARGGIVTTGIEGSGSAGQRAFDLIGGGLQNWKNQTGSLTVTVEQNAGPVGEAAALIAANAQKAYKTGKKYAPTLSNLLDKLASAGDDADDEAMLEFAHGDD